MKEYNNYKHFFFQALLCSFALNIVASPPPETCDGYDKGCEMREPQVLEDGLVVGCLSLEQKGQRTIYDDETWKFVQDVYDELFYSQTKDNHEYGYVDSFQYYILNEEEVEETQHLTNDNDPFTSIIVPHEIRYLPNGGGRGVFITQDLKESDVVFTPDAYGVFRTQSSWNTFVSVIASEDVELACDVLQWSYVQALEDGYYGVCMDLSVGSYLNHGGEESANLSVTNETHTAKRDIAAGEELLDDYSKYYEFGKLPWYEDMVSKAWEDECNIFGSSSDSSSDDGQWNYRVTRKK